MINSRETHKKKLKEGGITLISLIITIIVLLILAGVGLNAIFGESGIINNALRAKENEEISREMELISQANTLVEAQSKTGEITVDEMQDAMDNTVRRRKSNSNK